MDEDQFREKIARKPVDCKPNEAKSYFDDPWIHRSSKMRCATCMWFVAKAKELNLSGDIGRCRRHAPAMAGYPVVFMTDWCGDHKLDENKA